MRDVGEPLSGLQHGWILKDDRTTWVFHDAFRGQCSVGKWHKRQTLRQKQCYVWRKNQQHQNHPNYKSWWIEHRDLGLRLCLRSWAARYHSKFYQEVFTGECLEREVCYLTVKRGWVTQQGKNPGCRSKLTM